MTNLLDHLHDVATLAVTTHGLALMVVNLTPTPKDNEALEVTSVAAVKVYRVIEILAGIISKRAKQ
jgi:hypothetical protein